VYDGGPMTAIVWGSSVEAVEPRWPNLRSRWAQDVAVAAAVTALVLAVSGRIEPSPGDRRLDALAYVLIVVCGGVLALRRRFPVGVVLVIAGALALWLARGYVGGPVFATSWLALFFLGSAVDRRSALTTAAITSGLLVVVGVVADSSPGAMHGVYVGWAAAAVFLGDVTRSHRAHVAGLEERARHLEQTREEETRRRLAEERLRIARDLHDTVAHSMATINVQARAASRVIGQSPEQARDALLVIENASGEVLDELAAVLEVLRVDPDEEMSKAPTPGVGDLVDLVASARRAGLEVDLLGGADGFGDVPRSVGIAVYRIVQESLTNVVRHAGSSSATVTLTRDRDGTRSVEITDTGAGGHGTGPVGAGVGVRGMRERAETTGGELEAGPGPCGGFRVRATWPAL
jgi:signal transduction histidine kinase